MMKAMKAMKAMKSMFGTLVRKYETTCEAVDRDASTEKGFRLSWRIGNIASRSVLDMLVVVYFLGRRWP